MNWRIFDENAADTNTDIGAGSPLVFAGSQIAAIRARARGYPGIPAEHIPVAFVHEVRPPRGLWGLGQETFPVAGYTEGGICAVGDPPAGGARLVHVLAHEIGHWFLGAGHVSVPTNLMWRDPNITPGATQLTADQCRGIRGKRLNPSLQLP